MNNLPVRHNWILLALLNLPAGIGDPRHHRGHPPLVPQHDVLVDGLQGLVVQFSAFFVAVAQDALVFFDLKLMRSFFLNIISPECPIRPNSLQLVRGQFGQDEAGC